MEMSDKWVLWLMATLGCVAWGAVILRLIYRLLKTTREPGFSPWPRDIWGAAGRVSLIALALGVVLIPGGHITFLLALYPARYWCVAAAALLAIIFGLGSSVERRVAGATGILVLGGLEVYSAVGTIPKGYEDLAVPWELAPPPRYGPIVEGYAAFCLVLATIAVVRRLRRHHNPVASTG
jgi:hypothetical protein